MAVCNVVYCGVFFMGYYLILLSDL